METNKTFDITFSGNLDRANPISLEAFQEIQKFAKYLQDTYGLKAFITNFYVKGSLEYNTK